MSVFTPSEAQLEAWLVPPDPTGTGDPLPEAARSLEARRREAMRTAAADGSAHVRGAGDEAAGVVAGWQLSPWDSEQLGVTVAKMLEPVAWGGPAAVVEAAAALAAGVADEARDEGVELVVSRVAASYGAVILGWRSGGFELADVNVRFRREAAPRPPRRDVRCAPAQPEDRGPLVALASSFVDDHFHADARVPPGAADALYARWIENSLDGRATATLVARVADREEAAGFVTCIPDDTLSRLTGRPTGVIELVASAPWARGRGVGAALVDAAVGWFAENGTAVVDVGTQLGNEAARKLYRSCGFVPVAAAATLHCWAGGGSPGGSEAG